MRTFEPVISSLDSAFKISQCVFGLYECLIDVVKKGTSLASNPVFPKRQASGAEFRIICGARQTDTNSVLLLTNLSLSRRLSVC